MDYGVAMEPGAKRDILLYHGTRLKFVVAIRANGLLPPDVESIISSVASPHGISVPEVLEFGTFNFLKNARAKQNVVCLTPEIELASRYALRSPEIAWQALDIVYQIKFGAVDNSRTLQRERDAWRDNELKHFGSAVVVEMLIPWNELDIGDRKSILRMEQLEWPPNATVSPGEVRLSQASPDWFQRVIEIED